MNRSVTTPNIIGSVPQTDKPTVINIACRSISTKSSPLTVRMCPPATLRNWKFHKPLLAVGSANGLVQIFDLATGKVYRELAVHTFPVRGIEWVGLNAFISYAVSDSHQSSDYHWELHVTELDTGRSVKLNSGRSDEHSVIQSVKASHLRHYFIIVYKNNPFEIWDLETLSLLRRVPKKFSGIVAAEWSPLYSKKIDAPQAGSGNTTSSTDGSGKISNSPLRENFVVTNKMGELLHFSIAGNVVKEISKIPPESTVNKAVTSIAWKSDHVVLGRNDGSLNVWDLSKKETRTVSSMRGSIRKIRFAPGRGNMKILVLFEDGADIWDILKLRLVNTVIIPRGTSSKVEDADWAASDRPVILASNGAVVVTDLQFKQFNLTQQETETSKADTSVSRSQSGDPCYLQ